MNLGFKDRFIPYVEDGTKRHTIRAGDRWKAGIRADLFEKPRQKGMRLLFRADVIKVERIKVCYEDILARRIQSRRRQDLRNASRRLLEEATRGS